MDGVGESAGTVPAWAKRRRFDVIEYHRMAEAQILHEDDPVELIDGELIELSPIGVPHIGTIMALHRLLFRAAPDDFHVSVQNSLRLDRWNEPEPDLVLLRPRADRYRVDPPPTVADPLLVVEIADSSLRHDTRIKRPLYARHGIPEYWIVDLPAQSIEVCRAPAGNDYGNVRRAGLGMSIEPLALPGVRIVIDDVLNG